MDSVTKKNTFLLLLVTLMLGYQNSGLMERQLNKILK